MQEPVPHATDGDAPIDELPEGDHPDLAAAARAQGCDLQALQQYSAAELLLLLHAEGLDVRPGLDQGELVFALLQHRFARCRLGWIEGVLDVLPDGFGFLRSIQNAYAPGPADVYVSATQIRRLNLKHGQQVAGPIRPPRRDEQFFALLQVASVDGGDLASLRTRVAFGSRTPILPTQRLRLDHPGVGPDQRALDLLTPWGKGQRVLVVAPPGADRTRLLLGIAEALLPNHPEVHVSMCMLDERPEVVTGLRRALRGPRSDVVASTFDEPLARHLATAEMAQARAQRMVEAGRDVVLLFDSLTALARACNVELPPSGRMLCAGLDAQAVQRGKRLFGAARQLEEGGSLTVIATALRGSGSRLDEAILDEFQHRGNAEVVLDGELADLHVDPAFDVLRTATRHEDLLLDRSGIAALGRLRQQLAPLSRAERVAKVLELLQASATNDELLARL